MRLKALEAFALSLPGATLSIQWGEERVYKVGGKMFAVAGGKAGAPRVSFKCNDLAFEMLIRKAGVEPAPYLARAKWVYLADVGTMAPDELRARLREAHRLVVEKLPKNRRPAPAEALAPAAPKVKTSSGGRKRRA